ncbi:MAG: MFS transporter [Patescibacteria group bacterium]
MSRFWNTAEIPSGAKVLTRATGLRWIGWGFAESLIPILLFSFGNSFAEAGLLRSMFDIAFILALPIVGILADKMRATTLILVGLFIYFFVGAGYLLAGVTGLAIFIVLARFLNGIAFALDAIGRETYVRRHTPANKIATVFGYFDTVSNFWWIVASIAGIFLIKYFSIPLLLFMITPTSIIAFIIVWRFRKKEKEIGLDENKIKDKTNNIFTEIKNWNLSLKSLVCFNFFINFAGMTVLFFLPIEVYKEGGSLTSVIIMGIVSALPMLSGWSLGKWFDVKGSKTFSISLLFFSLLLLSLSFLTGYIWRLIIAFLITMISEFLYVGSNEMVTTSSNPEHFGRVDGIMRSITTIGGMAGPLVVGILMDMHGAKTAYISLAALVFALAVIFHILDGNGFMKKYQLIER